MECPIKNADPKQQILVAVHNPQNNTNHPQYAVIKAPTAKYSVDKYDQGKTTSVAASAFCDDAMTEDMKEFKNCDIFVELGNTVGMTVIRLTPNDESNIEKKAQTITELSTSDG